MLVRVLEGKKGLEDLWRGIRCDDCGRPLKQKILASDLLVYCGIPKATGRQSHP